jgi:hypothetical protein
MTDHEEILFEGYDSGWDETLPVTLITYKDGSMDIHRQSGSHFNEHIKESEKVLEQRGLKIDPNDSWAAGASGIYRRVVRV